MQNTDTVEGKGRDIFILKSSVMCIFGPFLPTESTRVSDNKGMVQDFDIDGAVFLLISCTNRIVLQHPSYRRSSGASVNCLCQLELYRKCMGEKTVVFYLKVKI